MLGKLKSSCVDACIYMDSPTEVREMNRRLAIVLGSNPQTWLNLRKQIAKNE